MSSVVRIAQAAMLAVACTAGVVSAQATPAADDLPYVEDLTTLRSGVRLANQSSIAGHPKYYLIRVPWGTTRLDVEVTGGSGDPHVYVTRGVKPTITSHACGPKISGDPRQCSIPRPTTLGHTPGQGDDWYIRLDTETSFTDVAITATTVGAASPAATTMKSCREWDSVLVNGAGWQVAGLPSGEKWEWTWGGGGLRVQHQTGAGEPARAARRYSLVTDPAARSGCSLRIGQNDRIQIHGYADSRLTIESSGRELELVARP